MQQTFVVLLRALPIAGALFLLTGPGDALAGGAVTVQVKGGTLVVTGDASANAVKISRPGDYRVEPYDGTTLINGDTSAKLFPASKGIRADLRGGANTLIVDNAVVSGPLDLKCDDAGDLAILGSIIEGSVLQRGGNGTDTLTIDDTDVEGGVSLKARHGDSAMVLNNGSLIWKDLKVDANDGFDTIVVQASDVMGRTSLKIGDGGSSTSVISSLLAKGFSLKAREDYDVLTATSSLIGGVDLKLGNGGSAVVFAGSDARVVGNLRMRSQAGMDVLTLAEVTLEGNLQVSTRDGGAVATLASWVEGNVQLKHRNGGTTVTHLGGIPGAAILGKTRIQTGAADSSFGCDLHLLRGDVKVSTKDGFAAGNVKLCVFEGSLAFDAGKGGGDLTIDASPAVAVIKKNLSFKGKGAPLTTALRRLVVEGKTSIRGAGSGQQVVVIDDVALEGPLSIKTGSGNDLVYIETNDTSPGPLASLFDGKVNISTGSGTDTIAVGAAPAVTSAGNFTKPVTYDGGTGEDWLAHQGNGNVYAVPPRLKSIENNL